MGELQIPPGSASLACRNDKGGWVCRQARAGDGRDARFSISDFGARAQRAQRTGDVKVFYTHAADLVTAEKSSSPWPSAMACSNTDRAALAVRRETSLLAAHSIA
jgi:hypothetical protein